MAQERTTVYFPSPGVVNTEATLKLAKAVAEKEGITSLIFASTRGYTAHRALELCPGFKLIAIGSYRYRSDPQQVEAFVAKGGLHAFAYEDISYDYPREVQDAYRTIGGEGGKVAAEVVVCAVKAGFIAPGEKVIGIGGTYPGADTAFLAIAADSFAKLKVTHIICTPTLDR